MRTERQGVIRSLISSWIVVALTVCLLPGAKAHNLAPWAQVYSLGNSGHYFFALDGEKKHIDGNTVYYAFNNNYAKTMTRTYVEQGITNWNGLISGVYCSLGFNAQVIIKYKDTVDENNVHGTTSVFSVTGANYHIPKNTLFHEAFITFYDFGSLGTREKNIITAHEIGHLWGIKDLYDTWHGVLSSVSIYDFLSSSTPDAPTVSDRNAMRIGIEDYWAERESGVWYYNHNPGTLVPRGDVDISSSVTAEDARLVSRYAAQLDTPSEEQRKLADVDGDGDIDAIDARHVLRYSAGLIDRFPADH